MDNDAEEYDNCKPAAKPMGEDCGGEERRKKQTQSQNQKMCTWHLQTRSQTYNSPRMRQSKRIKAKRLETTTTL